MCKCMCNSVHVLHQLWPQFIKLISSLSPYACLTVHLYTCDKHIRKIRHRQKCLAEFVVWMTGFIPYECLRCGILSSFLCCPSKW